MTVFFLSRPLQGVRKSLTRLMIARAVNARPPQHDDLLRAGMHEERRFSPWAYLLR